MNDFIKAGERDEKVEDRSDPRAFYMPDSLLLRVCKDGQVDCLHPEHAKERRFRQQGRQRPEGRRHCHHQGYKRQLVQGHCRREDRLCSQEIH